MMSVEKRMATEIVLQAKEDGEEIWKKATLESLYDSDDAGVTYIPIRVWAEIVTLAPKHGVKINQYQ